MFGTAGQYQVDSNPIVGTRRLFAATRVQDQAEFVVKRPRAGRPLAREVAMLRHEYAVLSRLEGAPIAQALAFIEEPVVGLVLARAPGRSLDAIIAAGASDVRHILDYAVAMAETLSAIHARGFIHRDIKPQHFFLAGTTACLVDFGLATDLARERPGLLELDEISGTLAYVSPEQTGRTNHSVDQRSDLYSLGVTLYELCTGRRPFETEDALELVHAHVARTPVAPNVHRAELPRSLADIVMRLLAKSPDERYQTATGLLSDLRHARTLLGESEVGATFPLGKNDHSGALRVPEKLYGRSAQLETLSNNVRQAQAGRRALTLVTGQAGIGKSALVQEVHREALQRGHFVAGKFDQYSRGVPYSALASACSELVRVYLAAPGPVLDAWKARLKTALGDNAAVIVDVVPQLAWALGEQPVAPPLPPHEAQIRFERSFRRFMEASACREAPLVFFLDDLQWADTASLTILELMLTSESQTHLLVIGSYRDTEIEAGHPLSLLIERLARTIQIERIELEPLSRADVRELLSDALPFSQQSPEPLADLIFEKTSGNPFFVGQFLERLAAERRVVFEPGTGFRWDLDAIMALGATDNVVDLVVARLGALAPRTQEMLRLAACIGHTFRLRTLAIIAEAEPLAVLRELRPAVADGYLLPLSQDHRLLDDLLGAEDVEAVDASYRFVHDRVQQAALSILDDTERARVHLRVGRLLLSAVGEAGLGDVELFEVVTQLDLGRGQMVDPAELAVLARLNLRAALRARAAAAHASAVHLAGVCIELLGSAPFQTDYETSLKAHLVSAESCYLLHDESRALELIQRIDAHARSTLDRVPARNLRSTIVTNQGHPQEATAISVETLALLGMALPSPHDQAALGAAIGEAFGAFQAALGTREVMSLRELPAMVDPQQLALISTVAGAIPSVFQWNPSLMVLLVLRAVRLSLEHGTAPPSAFFYAQYGIVHHVITADPLRAHDFGLLALDLASRPECAAARGGVEFIYAEFLAPWVLPRAGCGLHFQRGIVHGLDAGDQLHAGYCMAVGVTEGLYAGNALPQLQADTNTYRKALAEQRDVLNLLLLDLVGRSLACLRGDTAAAGSMDGDGFSEERFELEAPPPVKAHYGAIKAMLRFLFGDATEARRIAAAIVPPPGVAFKVEYVFYHGMACAELARATPPEARAQLLAEADADLLQFEPWVRSSQLNFSALQLMLRAELLDVRGASEAALDAYQAAVEAASAAAAVHHLALAYERLGRFQLRAGRAQLARLSLNAAARQYELWGASGKAHQLRQELGRTVAFDVPEQIAEGKLTSADSSSGGGNRLDLTSAIRAVQAIASEIRLSPLLRRLLQILVENAGATRGVLLLDGEGGLKIRASLRVEPQEMRVELDEPLGSSDTLAASVVRYCARTLEPLVLDSAVRDARFAQDPFVLRCQPKSLACLPLVHQGKLVGVLYLENDTSVGAFSSGRLETLEFLAGHAAVALQNARLYDELQAANDNLERRVRERTAALSLRNQDMRRVLDNVEQGLLTVDLEGRLAPERSRAVDEWLGELEPGSLFSAYLARIDPRFAEFFRLSFRQLLEGELPEEVLLEQLPSKLVSSSRQFQLTYRPIHADGKLAALLVVIDDVTEIVRRARDEAEQKEEIALYRHFSEDRNGVLSFFEEGQALVDDLVDNSEMGVALQRNLHTLKGNAAVFGLATLAQHCHAAEDAVAENAFEPEHLRRVLERFAALKQALISFSGGAAAERVEVPRATLRALARDLGAGLSPTAAAASVERLLLEPVRPSLERLANYARALASRLGKAEPVVDVADGGCAMDGKKAAPLFATLVHLVRNAVDHGLETRTERQASGKESCRLSLGLSLDGSEACLTVQDNGRGIDWALVRQRACARGLPAEKNSDLVAALFSPEFSTREHATQVSGRGVGLAAVHAEVTRLSGRIAVESKPNEGTCFRIVVPASALNLVQER